MSQNSGSPIDLSIRFIKGDVKDSEEAINGALDIVAEWMNENINLRTRVRSVFKKRAVLTAKLVKGKEEEAQKYKDYFDYNEHLNKVVSHRFLAIARAEKEGLIRYKVQPAIEDVLPIFERFYVKSDNECS